MAAAVTTRAPKEVAPLKPSTRLTLTFRELAVEGKKDWRHCFLFARHAAENDEEMAKVMAARSVLANEVDLIKSERPPENASSKVQVNVITMNPARVEEGNR